MPGGWTPEAGHTPFPRLEGAVLSQNRQLELSYIDFQSDYYTRLTVILHPLLGLHCLKQNYLGNTWHDVFAQRHFFTSPQRTKDSKRIKAKLPAYL